MIWITGRGARWILCPVSVQPSFFSMKTEITGELLGCSHLCHQVRTDICLFLQFPLCPWKRTVVIVDSSSSLDLCGVKGMLQRDRGMPEAGSLWALLLTHSPLGASDSPAVKQLQGGRSLFSTLQSFVLVFKISGCHLYCYLLNIFFDSLLLFLNIF